MIDSTRALCIIARDIKNNWPKVSPHARPYLDAMFSLNSMTDTYGSDDAESIVLYFLTNAQGWRGNAAGRLKNELRIMLKR